VKATVGIQAKEDLVIEYGVHTLRGKQIYLVMNEEDKD
jgi:hypothetical protein